MYKVHWIKGGQERDGLVRDDKLDGWIEWAKDNTAAYSWDKVEGNTYKFAVSYKHKPNLFITETGADQLEALAKAEAKHSNDDQYLAVIPENPTEE
jgi:hypothetical protein